MLLVSTGAVACTERILDLDPPDGMAFIPGGSNSGTNPLGVGESYSTDYPASYSLTVTAFYMDKTEITKAQWDTVYSWAITNGYSFDNAGSGKAMNHPVQTVNWYDCVKWCNARSQMEGTTPCYTVSGNVYKTGSFGQDGSGIVDCNFSASGYRLPTSDEWEYAARGGYSSRRFPWGDTIQHTKANYKSSSSYSYDTSSTRGYLPSYDEGDYPYTSPAGSFSANGYGLYDMSGNVWEWCNDWVPVPGYEGSFRDLRGGCWDFSASDCRAGKVGGVVPNGLGTSIGFRSVRSAN